MKRNRKLSQCPNCLAQLDFHDNYCANCGQKNQSYNNSLRELWGDVTGSIFNFDGKVWATLLTLFRRPGKLSLDYIQGRKIRYVPPMRLYFFVSFLYFLILNIGVNQIIQSEGAYVFIELIDKLQNNSSRYTFGISDKEYSILKNSSSSHLLRVVDEKLDANDSQDLKFDKDDWNLWIKNNAIDSIYLQESKLNFNVKIGLGDTNLHKEKESNYLLAVQLKSNYDTILIQNKKYLASDLEKIHKDKRFLQELVTQKLKPDGLINYYSSMEILHMYSLLYFGNYTEKLEYLNSKLKNGLSYFSYSLLLIMPISAIILLIFFSRRHNQYLSHVIFSIHQHVLLILAYTVIFLIIVGTSIIGVQDFILNFTFISITFLIVYLFLIIYFIASIKNFYKVKLKTAIFKGLLAHLIYSMVFLFLFTFVIFLSFIF